MAGSRTLAHQSLDNAADHQNLNAEAFRHVCRRSLIEGRNLDPLLSTGQFTLSSKLTHANVTLFELHGVGAVPVYQLVYLSRATRTLSVDDMKRILIAAQGRNQVAEVTGLLLFDGRRFIQALEGPEEEVVAIMHRIKADRRHRDIVYMPSSYVSERQFGSWSMHGRWLNDVDEAETFYRETSTLLKSVSNPEVLAAFLGFASMSRAPFRRAKSGTDTDADLTSLVPPID